jgi:hypothetical protein
MENTYAVEPDDTHNGLRNCKNASELTRGGESATQGQEEAIVV